MKKNVLERQWIMNPLVTEDTLRVLHNKKYSSKRDILIGDRILVGFMEIKAHDDESDTDFTKKELVTFHIDEIDSYYKIVGELKAPADDSKSFPLLKKIGKA